MRYPTLNTGQVRSVVDDLVSGRTPSCDTIALWRGAGESIEFEDLDAVLAQLKLELEVIGTDPTLTKDKEPFEGAVAVAIYGFLDSLPLDLLDDPGFWRYLAMSRFWWFVEWREADPLAAGNVLTYVDGRRNTEHIPLRLYLRVKAVAVGDNKALAAELKKCTDFWRSHVIRVRTGTAPTVARAFAQMQAGEGRLPTSTLRPYARRLNRMWTNVQLGLYDQAHAEAMIQELRE